MGINLIDKTGLISINNQRVFKSKKLKSEMRKKYEELGKPSVIFLVEAHKLRETQSLLHLT